MARLSEKALHKRDAARDIGAELLASVREMKAGKAGRVHRSTTVRESKRKKLESKGWRIGTPKEFLKMTDEEEAYVSLRLKLAEGLKKRRHARGVTQVGLARAIKSSQSRVAKMEAGDPTVSLDLLVKSLLALGTSNRELATIIARS